MHLYTVLEPSLASYCILLTVPATFRLYHYNQLKVALHYNFDTRDDCTKRVQLVGANRVHWMRLLHRVQMHPVLLHFVDYDGASLIGRGEELLLIFTQVDMLPACQVQEFLI